LVDEILDKVNFASPFAMSASTNPLIVPSYAQPLPRWLALWVPLLMLVYPFILMIPGLNWEQGLDREFGLVENLTVLFLFSAFIVALRTLPYRLGALHGAALVVLALGAFVFMGEEISWGQHFLGFSTPEKFMEINRQHETNIHNINGTVEFIFTKVIRSALSVGSVVGGLIIPLVLSRKKLRISSESLHFWLWPSLGAALASVLVNTVGVPNKIANHFDSELPNYFGPHTGEMKEAFLALIILLYAVAQYRVSRQMKA
jgi:hypothetical protein